MQREHASALSFCGIIPPHSKDCLKIPGCKLQNRDYLKTNCGIFSTVNNSSYERSPAIEHKSPDSYLAYVVVAMSIHPVQQQLSVAISVNVRCRPPQNALSVTWDPPMMTSCNCHQYPHPAASAAPTFCSTTPASLCAFPGLLVAPVQERAHPTRLA